MYSGLSKHQLSLPSLQEQWSMHCIVMMWYDSHQSPWWAVQEWSELALRPTSVSNVSGKSWISSSLRHPVVCNCLSRWQHKASLRDDSEFFWWGRRSKSMQTFAPPYPKWTDLISDWSMRMENKEIYTHVLPVPFCTLPTWWNFSFYPKEGSFNLVIKYQSLAVEAPNARTAAGNRAPSCRRAT